MRKGSGNDSAALQKEGGGDEVSYMHMHMHMRMHMHMHMRMQHMQVHVHVDVNVAVSDPESAGGGACLLTYAPPFLRACGCQRVFFGRLHAHALVHDMYICACKAVHAVHYVNLPSARGYAFAPRRSAANSFRIHGDVAT